MLLDLSVICRVEDPDDRIAESIASVVHRVREVWVLDLHGVAADAAIVGARRVAIGGSVSPAAEQSALAGCGCPWVLWLEPDEVATPGLLDRFEAMVREDRLGRMGGFRVTVRTAVAGRVLGAGGCGPRGRLRLFRRDGSRYAPRPGAEVIAPPASAPLGRLREAIEERPFHGFDAHLRRAERQVRRELEGHWPPSRTLELLAVWPVTFTRHWILERGFRDGRAGALWAGARATAAFVRAMRIWVEAQTTAAPHPGDAATNRRS